MLFKLREGYGKHIVPIGKNKTKVIFPGDIIEVSTKDELKGALDKFERIHDDEVPVPSITDKAIDEEEGDKIQDDYREKEVKIKKTEKKNKWKRGEEK